MARNQVVSGSLVLWKIALAVKGTCRLVDRTCT
jgi:hypothetical protein